VKVPTSGKLFGIVVVAAQRSVALVKPKFAGFIIQLNKPDQIWHAFGLQIPKSWKS
jgi:hypothetical protein